MTEKGLRRSGYVPLAKADGASPQFSLRPYFVCGFAALCTLRNLRIRIFDSSSRSAARLV